MSPSEAPSSGLGLLSRARGHPRAALFGLLLVLGLLLHRPLLRAAFVKVLKIAAARQDLAFDARISGNMVTRCILEGVRVDQGPKGNARLAWLRVRRAEFHYNPLQLLLRGRDRGLSRIEIEGLEAGLSSSKGAPQKKVSPSEVPQRWNRALLNLPIFWCESLNLSAISITTVDDPGGFQLQGGSLSAQPGSPGVLAVESLHIAGEADFSIPQRAATSYEEGKFELRDVKISPAIQLTRLGFETSARGHGMGKMELEVLCGGGTLSADLQTSPDEWFFHAEATQIEAETLRETVGRLADQMPDLRTARIDASGNPHRPHSWKGSVQFACERALRGGARGVLECGANLQAGTLTLTSLDGTSPSSRIHGSGRLDLPATLEKFSEVQAGVELDFSSSRIEEWLSSPDAARLAGAVKGAAKLKLGREGFQTEVQIFGDSLQTGAIGAKRCRIDGSFSAPAKAPLSAEHIAGNAVISLLEPAVSTATFSAGFEEGACALSLEGGTARFWNILFKDAANTFSGEISLPLTRESAPPVGSLRLEANDLSVARIHFRDHPVRGGLLATWTGGHENGRLTGRFILAGTSLSWGAFQAPKIQANASIEDQKLTLSEATLEWSGPESVRASGFLDMEAGRRYDLKVEAHLPGLERLSPLLEQMGVAQHGISGALDARWEGTGSLVDKSGSGQWHLSVKNGQWEKIRLEMLECEGRHQPGSLVIEPLRLATKSTRFGAQIHWTPGALRFSKVALEQWGHPSLSGGIVLPLTYDKEGLHWVKDTEISGQLKADKLDLGTLLTINGTPSPVKGALQLELDLAGEPSDPTATLRCTATSLRPADLPQFGTSTVTLDARYARGALTATAGIATPFQGPVRLASTLSMPLADLFAGKVHIQDLPLEASIQATNLNLTALPGLLSGLRKVSGQASLDLKLRGTPANPTWQGSLKADCPVLHFSSDRLPAVGGLSLAAEILGKELRLTRFKADLGGGNLEVQGTAGFATPDNPLLEFKAKAHEVLVVRNSKLALRLNGDLSLKGPLKHAEISGLVSPTKSRLQKDIEVLPLSVLRMEIPKETRTTGKPWFVFRKAPFSDWRFNVEMRTKPGDPLLLRGNRLRGSLDAEMQLEGTGAAPTIHGAYRSTDLTATLPFARIELSRGRIWYTRDHPFQPHVDLSAETEVRNHRIRLYLHGPANAPHISASSEPPEPETDLLTLIATGTLPRDVNEKSQVLASRAAAVLFQEFSDKLLPSGERERFSALRRFSLDLGAINNRSGQQETRLTYRVLDDLFVIGELRTGGDFAARVRYLLRFR
jgi:hypothetical protein